MWLLPRQKVLQGRQVPPPTADPTNSGRHCSQWLPLVWLRQNRQWSRAPTPAHSLWRLQRHSVEQLRPTKPKWQRQWSGSTHEPFTQPWAQTGRHSPVVLSMV